MSLRFAREFSQDARYTLRLWAARPWQTLFAVAALAIGIGANTGAFSVVNALVLRELPFRDPERLGAFRNLIAPHDSAAQFHEWRRTTPWISAAALSEQGDVNLGAVRDPGRVHMAQVSSNFFSTLGVQPALGRAFLPDEDSPDRNTTVVVSHNLWQQLYAGDPRVLGQTLRINGTPLTIVGVAPAGFDFPGHSALWQPGRFTPGNNGWDTVVRLAPGVSWDQARQAFSIEARRIIPHPWPGFNPLLFPLQQDLAGPARSASVILLAAVALILLIACLNVANLLLARAADRSTELAIRSALGAGRARIARQLLTESVLLSMAASAAGLVVALWTVSLAASTQPTPLAAQSYGLLDGRVLGFCLALGVVCGLLFGVLPALYAGRRHTFETQGSGTTRSARRIRETLIAAQVALTIVLLTSSVSVGRAFVRLMRLDRGWSAGNLVTVSVSLNGTTHEGADRQFAYFEQILDRVRRLPGISTASATEFLPVYATGFMGAPFSVDGRRQERSSMVAPVFSDYFKTMGARLLAGREFTAAEVRSHARLAIVNEPFVRESGFAPAEAIGRQIAVGTRPWTIIGVVANMDYMTDGANGKQVFIPSTNPGGFFSTVVARIDGPAAARVAAIRDAIRAVDPEVPVFAATTMQERFDRALARPRFYATAVNFFAGFALLLAVLGIYAAVSYAVAQRTREMGVRLALGGIPVRLRAMLLRRGIATVAAGAIPGLAGAILAGRLLGRLIEGAQPLDTPTAALSILILLATAAASVWAATRRIATLDVVTILRAE